MNADVTIWSGLGSGLLQPKRSWSENDFQSCQCDSVMTEHSTQCCHFNINALSLSSNQFKATVASRRRETVSSNQFQQITENTKLFSDLIFSHAVLLKNMKRARRVVYISRNLFSRRVRPHVCENHFPLLTEKNNLSFLKFSRADFLIQFEVGFCWNRISWLISSASAVQIFISFKFIFSYRILFLNPSTSINKVQSESLFYILVSC